MYGRQCGASSRFSAERSPVLIPLTPTNRLCRNLEIGLENSVNHSFVRPFLNLTERFLGLNTEVLEENAELCAKPADTKALVNPGTVIGTNPSYGGFGLCTNTPEP